MHWDKRNLFNGVEIELLMVASFYDYIWFFFSKIWDVIELKLTNWQDFETSSQTLFLLLSKR
jgi:hypothetical protein